MSIQRSLLSARRIDPNDKTPNQHQITVIWTSWRLKSPTSRLFVEQLVLGNIKKKVLYYWPFGRGKPSVTSGFPSQRASDAKCISMSRRHVSVSQGIQVKLWQYDIRWWSDSDYRHVTTSYIDGLVQDCSISIAKALDILQSCTELYIYICEIHGIFETCSLFRVNITTNNRHYNTALKY